MGKDTSETRKHELWTWQAKNNADAQGRGDEGTRKRGLDMEQGEGRGTGWDRRRGNSNKN